MSDTKATIEKWTNETCLGYIKLSHNADIERAMNLAGNEIRALDLAGLDEIIVTLANYLIYLAKEMGTIYARVKYLESAGSDRVVNERIKLSIIKPVHDALRVKLDVLKTIYNGKLRATYVGSSRS